MESAYTEGAAEHNAFGTQSTRMNQAIRYSSRRDTCGQKALTRRSKTLEHNLLNPADTNSLTSVGIKNHVSTSGITGRSPDERRIGDARSQVAWGRGNFAFFASRAAATEGAQRASSTSVPETNPAGTYRATSIAEAANQIMREHAESSNAKLRVFHAFCEAFDTTARQFTAEADIELA